jgi:DNA polymerase-3 subunit beta
MTATVTRPADAAGSATVTVRHADLVAALATAGIARGSTGSPLGDLLVVDVAGDQVTLGCSDYETSVTAGLAATTVGGTTVGGTTVDGPAVRFMVRHSELTKTLAALTGKISKRRRDELPVRLTGSVERAVEQAGEQKPVRTAGLAVADYEVPLWCGDPADALRLTRCQAPAVAVVDRLELVAAAVQTLVAVGRDDTLPMLTTLQVTVQPTQIRMGATDRYRMTLATVPTAVGEATPQGTVFLPGAALRALLPRLTGHHVSLHIDQDTVSLRSGQVTATWSNTPPDNPVDVDGHMARTIGKLAGGGQVDVKREALVDAVDTASRLLAAQQAKPASVELLVEDGQVRVVALLPDHPAGMRAPAIPASVSDLSTPTRLRFNPAYLLDALTSIAGPTVMLRAENRPAASVPVLVAGADERYTHLVMSLRAD